MKIIEHKIDETFCLEDGTRLKIAKAVCNCRNCYFFNNENNHCSKPKNVESCYSLIREDKESINFKQIKNNNMKEKRNIQIPLEEAREWYNSGDSFKKELAFKAYSKYELATHYRDITAFLKDADIADSIAKAEVYRKVLNISKYYNSFSPKEYSSHFGSQQYYIITKKRTSTLYFKYKDFFINKSVCKSDYEIAFNSREAAKQAINILGDELNVLFE